MERWETRAAKGGEGTKGLTGDRGEGSTGKPDPGKYDGDPNPAHLTRKKNPEKRTKISKKSYEER